MKIPAYLEIACEYDQLLFTVDMVCQKHRISQRHVRDRIRSLLLLPDRVVKLKKIKTHSVTRKSSFIYKVEYVHPDILSWYQAEEWHGPVPAVLKHRLKRCGETQDGISSCVGQHPGEGAVTPCPESLRNRSSRAAGRQDRACLSADGHDSAASRRHRNAEEVARARQLWDAMVRCRQALSTGES